MKRTSRLLAGMLAVLLLITTAGCGGTAGESGPLSGNDSAVTTTGRNTAGNETTTDAGSVATTAAKSTGNTTDSGTGTGATDSGGTTDSSATVATGGDTKAPISGTTTTTKGSGTTSVTRAPTKAPTTTAKVDSSLTYPQPDKNGNPTGFILSTYMAFAGYTDEATNRATVRNTRDAGFNLIEVTWLPEVCIMAALDATEKEGDISLLIQNARGAGEVCTNLGGIANSHVPTSVSQTAVNEWVNKTKNYKCLYGYYVHDEPYLDALNNAAALHDYYEAAAPNKLVFSNLLPSYGEYRWPDTYPAYVDSAVSTIDPSILCLDYYPFTSSTANVKTKNNLYRDLGYLRKKSMATGKPHWHYVQAVGAGSGSITSVDQIRVQMSIALAYGVTGISYFTSKDSIISERGVPLAMYEDAKAMNLKARAIGDTLFGATKVALHHTGLDAKYDETYYLDPLSSSAYIASAPDGLVIGVFSKGGATYLAVANKDHEAAVTGTLKLKKAYTCNSYNGSTTSLGNTDTLSLSIPAGDIVLYTLK